MEKSRFLSRSVANWLAEFLEHNSTRAEYFCQSRRIILERVGNHFFCHVSYVPTSQEVKWQVVMFQMQCSKYINIFLKIIDPRFVARRSVESYRLIYVQCTKQSNTQYKAKLNSFVYFIKLVKHFVCLQVTRRKLLLQQGAEHYPGFTFLLLVFSEDLFLHRLVILLNLLFQNNVIRS